MAVQQITATAFSKHLTLTNAGDTYAVTLDNAYPRIQVVLTGTAEVAVTVDQGNPGPPANTDITIGADGTWRLTTQGDTIIVNDDRYATPTIPASIIRLKTNTAGTTVSVYGLPAA